LGMISNKVKCSENQFFRKGIEASYQRDISGQSFGHYTVSVTENMVHQDKLKKKFCLEIENFGTEMRKQNEG
jgi:hypothetical protein